MKMEECGRWLLSIEAFQYTLEDCMNPTVIATLAPKNPIRSLPSILGGLCPLRPFESSWFLRSSYCNKAVSVPSHHGSSRHS